MNKRRIARLAGLVCVAGAVIQIIYGLAAVLFPYPAILEPRYELLWALASAGMAGGVIGWLALDAARPRTVAVIGGGLAVVGYLIRIAISVLLMLDPSTAVDGPIVASILLMFLGVATVGIATLRGKRLAGWQAWAPLITVATGFITSAFYSIDKVVHFILLGLFWGPAWLLVGYLIVTQVRMPDQAAQTAPGRPAEHR